MNEYRIIEQISSYEQTQNYGKILSYGMNIELLNKYQVIKWTQNYGKNIKLWNQYRIIE